MSKKRSQGFSAKNRGVTPSVATPDFTHPSDATGITEWIAKKTYPYTTYQGCRKKLESGCKT